LAFGFLVVNRLQTAHSTLGCWQRPELGLSLLLVLFFTAGVRMAVRFSVYSTSSRFLWTWQRCIPWQACKSSDRRYSRSRNPPSWFVSTSNKIRQTKTTALATREIFVSFLQWLDSVGTFMIRGRNTADSQRLQLRLCENVERLRGTGKGRESKTG